MFLDDPPVQLCQGGIHRGVGTKTPAAHWIKGLQRVQCRDSREDGEEVEGQP